MPVLRMLNEGSLADWAKQMTLNFSLKYNGIDIGWLQWPSCLCKKSCIEWHSCAGPDY